MTLGHGTAAHTGVELEVVYNPAIDDPLAQWGDCMDSVLGCLKSGDDFDLPGCTAQSICPESCRSEYARRVEGVADKTTLVRTFQALFITKGAPCMPSRQPAQDDTVVQP